ncbi:hypothetical protein NDU88_001920 [Pleurodeles waltl]|uniref:Uncharacterized protein n=1 Tax=Pleurodeles waltl TaxID=8319 RepID=A0AAV7U7V7_PLEWA|nr:hypothetical protein NDU88_001920 [Pleurodeles waltl]
MAECRNLWEKAAAEHFDGTISNSEAGSYQDKQVRTAGTVIKELEKVCISELKKWWEMTSLTKYIENGRVPRGLHILILPTLGDMDSDLLEKWITYTADCSLKLMGTLITQSKRRMDEHTKAIEALTKVLELTLNQHEVQLLLEKMEERINKKEDEIKMRRIQKFNRDQFDYEHGRIYTFARKYDTLRMKEKMNQGGDVGTSLGNTDISSDPRSSADEASSNKLDFQGEMRLMQMSTPQSGRRRGRGRGGTRQGGGRGKDSERKDQA